MSARAVGFLGPRGTFSEVAAQRITAKDDVELVAVGSIINLIQGLASGQVFGGGQILDAAVVPIENSTEGSVGATLDTLVDHEDLVITAELDLPIEQLLVARHHIDLSEIEQIYSHPQGIAQARRFLADEVPQAGVVPISSTARAVELIGQTDEPWAAIGSRGAAEIHGCVILRDDIQELVNETRFVMVERRAAVEARSGAGSLDGPAGSFNRRAEDGGGPMKTTVVFEGEDDSSAGWLVRCLSEFAFRGVNLSKIESRPLRGHLGHYRFFVDLEGAATDPTVAAAIEGLGTHCSDVRILGSYPVAADPI